MPKTGLTCKYFCKRLDGGLILKESRDSLAKCPGRTGIYARGPLDLDLTDQIRVAHDLIWALGFGSDGS